MRLPRLTQPLLWLSMFLFSNGIPRYYHNSTDYNRDMLGQVLQWSALNRRTPISPLLSASWVCFLSPNRGCIQQIWQCPPHPHARSALSQHFRCWPWLMLCSQHPHPGTSTCHQGWSVWSQGCRPPGCLSHLCTPCAAALCHVLQLQVSQSSLGTVCRITVPPQSTAPFLRTTKLPVTPDKSKLLKGFTINHLRKAYLDPVHGQGEFRI